MQVAQPPAPSRTLRIVVIGAGVSGLAVAGRLRRMGATVTIVEKNLGPGGRCDELVTEGHRFDVGPSIILLPDAFEETYCALGEDMRDHLDLVRVDPAYRIHFPDATSVRPNGLLPQQIAAPSVACYARYRSVVGAVRTISIAGLVVQLELTADTVRMQQQLERVEAGSFTKYSADLAHPPVSSPHL